MLQGKERYKERERGRENGEELTYKKLFIDLLLLLMDVWIKETGQILKLGTEPFESLSNITEFFLVREFKLTLLDTAPARSQAAIVGGTHLIVEEQLLMLQPLGAAAVA